MKVGIEIVPEADVAEEALRAGGRARAGVAQGHPLVLEIHGAFDSRLSIRTTSWAGAP